MKMEINRLNFYITTDTIHRYCRLVGPSTDTNIITISIASPSAIHMYLGVLADKNSPPVKILLTEKVIDHRILTPV